MRAACTIVVFTLLLVPLAGEAIALEDRGYQFADGVYEVIKVLAGRPRDLERHLDRLECSLAALEIVAPMGRRGICPCAARRRAPCRAPC